MSSMPRPWLVVLVLLALGCLAAVACATSLSASQIRQAQRPARLATRMCGLALLLTGFGLITCELGKLMGWAGSTCVRMMAFAGIGAMLLAGMLHRSDARSVAGRVMNLALAWLAVAAGAWSIISALWAG